LNVSNKPVRQSISLQTGEQCRCFRFPAVDADDILLFRHTCGQSNCYEKEMPQTSAKYEQPLQSEERDLQYNIVLSFPLSDAKHRAIPMIELNGVKSLADGSNSLFLTPQVYIGLVRRGHLALSLGAQIPIAGARPFDYRIMTFMLWEYMDGGLWW